MVFSAKSRGATPQLQEQGHSHVTLLHPNVSKFRLNSPEIPRDDDLPHIYSLSPFSPLYRRSIIFIYWFTNLRCHVLKVSCTSFFTHFLCRFYENIFGILTITLKKNFTVSLFEYSTKTFFLLTIVKYVFHIPGICFGVSVHNNTIVSNLVDKINKNLYNCSISLP